MRFVELSFIIHVVLFFCIQYTNNIVWPFVTLLLLHVLLHTVCHSTHLCTSVCLKRYLVCTNTFYFRILILDSKCIDQSLQRKKTLLCNECVCHQMVIMGCRSLGSGRGGVMLPPSIRVGRLYPPHYYFPPDFSDLPMALLMVIINRNRIVF